MESDQMEIMNGDELSNQLDVVVSNKVGAGRWTVGEITESIKDL